MSNNNQATDREKAAPEIVISNLTISDPAALDHTVLDPATLDLGSYTLVAMTKMSKIKKPTSNITYFFDNCYERIKAVEFFQKLVIIIQLLDLYAT